MSNHRTVREKEMKRKKSIITRKKNIILRDNPELEERKIVKSRSFFVQAEKRKLSLLRKIFSPSIDEVYERGILCH